MVLPKRLTLEGNYQRQLSVISNCTLITDNSYQLNVQLRSEVNLLEENMVSTHDSQAEAEENSKLQLSCFYLDETLLGVDLQLVQEINDELNITKVPRSPNYVLGIMNLRGQIITVIDQGKKIGFQPSIITPDSRVIIVQSQGEFVGLLVDRISDVVTVKRKDISESPANIKGAQGRFFHGVIQTESHELLLQLNIEMVLADEPLRDTP